MLGDSARVLLRRWVWVILALVIALVGAGGIYKHIVPTQQGTAEILFVPSGAQPGTSVQTNPFYNLPTTAVMTAVIQSKVTDAVTAQRLTENGDTAKYQVSPNPVQNSGPTLIITATDKSPAMVDRTLNAVLSQMKQQLHDLQVQQQVPPSLFITSLVLTQDPQPKPMHKSQIQLAVVVFIVIMVALIALILLAERIRTSRQAKRAKAAEQVAASGQPATHNRRRGGRRSDDAVVADSGATRTDSDADADSDAYAEADTGITVADSNAEAGSHFEISVDAPVEAAAPSNELGAHTPSGDTLSLDDDSFDQTSSMDQPILASSRPRG